MSTSRTTLVAERAFTITSHPLCPFMHAWRIALAGAGKRAASDYEVVRLEYEDAARWRDTIPPETEIPWLTKDEAHLSGALPVLQWIEETVPGTGLLADHPAERLRSRNRALLATELLSAMRTVFTSKTDEGERTSLDALFAVLARCEAQAWSPRGRVDWVVMAAASTLLASRSRIIADTRWTTLPKTRALVLALSRDDLVTATSTDDYAAAFRAFHRAFGGRVDEPAAPGL